MDANGDGVVQMNEFVSYCNEKLPQDADDSNPNPISWERVGPADVQPLTLYEFILFTTTTYGCLHVERINYSLSLLSHLT